MSIKLILLQSGEQIVSDAREVIAEEKTVAYLFKNPQKVTINKPFLLTEEEVESNDKVQITLGPWMLLSADDEIAVPTSYVVTIVDPIESLEKMYIEKTSPPKKGISNFQDLLTQENLDKLRQHVDLDNLDLQKLAEIYTPEELQSLKELYLGNSNETDDQVSSFEE